MRIVAAFSFVLVLANAAAAQGLGYAEGGLAGVSGFPGRWSDSIHAGAGGEVIAANHVGIGGEVGFFNRLIVGSANATLHLGSLARRSLGGGGGARVSPFITGGYTRMGIGDGEGAFSAFNIGAGLHVWTGNRAGIRLEFRDHYRPDDRGNTHYWSIRAGIAFR